MAFVSGIISVCVARESIEVMPLGRRIAVMKEGVLL
jgi:hypothetical protein